MSLLSLVSTLVLLSSSLAAQEALNGMWYLTPGLSGPLDARLGENTPNWSQVNQGSSSSETYIPFRFNRRESTNQTSNSSDFTDVTNINEYAQSFGLPPAAICRVGDEIPAPVSTPRPSPLRPLPALTSAFDVGRDRSGQEYCSQFIKSDGSYGVLGDFVVEQIRSLSSDRALTREDLPTMQGDESICPNWQQLTQEEREHFWVWVAAAVAWDESKCGHPNWMVNQNNRDAVGMLQMNLNPDRRNFRGRPCRTGRGESITQHEPNLRCGVHILSDLLNPPNMYETNGHLYAPNSYWEKLRPRSTRHGSIDEKVASYPLCRQ